MLLVKCKWVKDSWFFNIADFHCIINFCINLLFKTYKKMFVQMKLDFHFSASQWETRESHFTMRCVATFPQLMYKLQMKVFDYFLDIKAPSVRKYRSKVTGKYIKQDRHFVQLTNMWKVSFIFIYFYFEKLLTKFRAFFRNYSWSQYW